MSFLGEIARLQLQRQSLMRGTGPARYYDPSPLLAVEELILTPGGACASTPDGGCLVDIHHASHPFSRHRGMNALSIGFARHYDAMHARFGNNFAFGCAGESIIIDGPAARITLAEVTSGIVIATEQGLVTLTSVLVAEPCAPFCRYALGSPDASNETIKATLQFLDHGVRGFYCAFTGSGPVTIHRGAKVFSAA